jgi:RNA polymerase sigma-70 factor (ECF subfamily)
MDADTTQRIAELRPRLHRYCARMVGSAFDGEDVLQEALAKAAIALRGGAQVERLEGWLLGIAHNTALDLLRRRKREARLLEVAATAERRPSDDTAARVAAHASLSLFVQLPPLPRAAVVLVDVLGHSAEEARAVLGVTLPSLKAALNRGRTRLRGLAGAEAPAPAFDPAERARLQAYADRFNDRDFDAVRALLAEDVRLDLVARTKLVGKTDVAVYFHRYAEARHWRLGVGLAEGRPALLVSNPDDPDHAVTYVILLDWRGGEVAGIRDFFHAVYVMNDLQIAQGL